MIDPVPFWAWVARWFLRGSPEGKALDEVERRLTQAANDTKTEVN